MSKIVYVILDRGHYQYLTDQHGGILTFSNKARCFRYLQRHFTQYQKQHHNIQRVADAPLEIKAFLIDDEEDKINE
ncbi:hypothetical protein LMC02_09740 [Limosilactobacillus reuteri]|uniref:hypothetical protein n=1 Tax=Limosilactobacillus reuteri TaxID=1598 RepID=UPI001E3AAFA3|nr:hypothetical protein [Limosilactobacillus reuteri]MCC4500268.1 hypothetical protein [Limosilactobacillus reuteri]MCC4500593.1 hypothetical protein [Limosilactobacillus reuteri]